MVVKQQFVIVPHGLIQSGSAEFSADTVSGEIDADEDIIAGAFIFTKEIKNSGIYKVDPSLLLSTSIVAGMKFSAGIMVARVTSMSDDKKSASVAVSVVDQDSDNQVNLSGFVELDLSAEYWEVVSVTLSGIAQSESVTIELKPI